MTVAELLEQLAEAYDRDDEVDTFMIRAGDDPMPVFWPPFRRGGEGGWTSSTFSPQSVDAPVDN